MSRYAPLLLVLAGCGAATVPPPPDVQRFVLPDLPGPVSVVGDGAQYTRFEEDCRPQAVKAITEDLGKRGVAVTQSGAASVVRIGCFVRRTRVLVWDRQLDPFTHGTCVLPVGWVLTLHADVEGPTPATVEVGGTGPILDRATCHLTSDGHERAFWRAFGIDRGERRTEPGELEVEDRESSQ